jgi:mRNA-degrading endonuclease YafQ of YafQ-DinJ toxin-antitoxin module
MLTLRYKPSFVRAFAKLPAALQYEALERVEQFKNPAHHHPLRVHKLHGALKGFYSFSVTYSHRIVFQYESKTMAVLVAIGDHDVYR